MIALPFSDTPIINRNKEFRKKAAAGGGRRSSLGMRGRRASSLVRSPRMGVLGRALFWEDFGARSEFSDWFAREDAPRPPIPVVLQPNPRNIDYEKKIEELEARIERLLVL
ncbi:hypothetical protein N0V88_000966 [Collariella sp. IMI 366227]|nr:hypothetical protein N0V88_000966 [Collariella sp. IMI 366227]